VLEPLGKQTDDVLVVEGVEDQLAGAALADEARLAEETELMGNGRIRQSEEVGDVADAELGAEEGIEDADAGGIGEHLEDVGETADELAIEEVVWRYLNI
jgi:hypothetical protein